MSELEPKYNSIIQKLQSKKGEGTVCTEGITCQTAARVAISINAYLSLNGDKSSFPWPYSEDLIELPQCPLCPLYGEILYLYSQAQSLANSPQN